MKRPFGVPGPEERRAWVDVALGRRAPTRYLRGARVLHVFTGEVLEAGVAILGDRIAYVGPHEPALGPETEVDDLPGRLLVPGYVEVHAHPFQLYSPATLGAAAAARGTTTLVGDTLAFLHLLGPRVADLLDLPLGAPARLLWGLRTAPQTQPGPAPAGADAGGDRILRAAFGMGADELVQLLDHPRVVQVFEWTEWHDAVRGGAPLPPVLAAALARGLPVDAHAPGASHRTLAALAAAGAGDDHESIRADEVLERLRLGFYVPLRHSSLRPDLPDLVAAVRATDGFERLMLTTDGPTPSFLAAGLMDQAVRAAVACGLRFADTVRMATLHPAAYLGLDRDVGAIAPGRLADVLVLRDPDDPVPERVYVGGVPVAEEGRLLAPPPAVPWVDLGLAARPWAVAVSAADLQARPELLGAPDPAPGAGDVEVPVVELLNAVITRRGTARLPVRGGVLDLAAAPDLCLAVLLSPPGRGPVRPVARALVRGMGAVAGLATTYTCAFAPLVVGRSPAAMSAALARVAAAGGGIALYDEDGERFFLPLEVGGAMTDLPVPELARRCAELEALLRERGHPFHDPIYTLLFLSANHLPAVRLTAAGLWDVKRREAVYGPEAVA